VTKKEGRVLNRFQGGPQFGPLHCPKKNNGASGRKGRRKKMAKETSTLIFGDGPACFVSSVEKGGHLGAGGRLFAIPGGGDRKRKEWGR